MAIIQSGRGGRHVLLVEGAPSIYQRLGRRLKLQGVALTAVDSVRSALEVLHTRPFNVVIIDLLLPDGSGLEVLDVVRASDPVPQVIVMGGVPEARDRTMVRERGADHYMVKPCAVRKLASRVLVAGRWAGSEPDALLKVGRFTIDLQARQVRDAGRLLELTGKEFDLLAFLAARPGHVFSRAELLGAVWQSTPEWQQAATVTEHIRRLRAKIEIEPRHPQILRTVRGSGYRFDLRGTTPEAELVGRKVFDLAAPTSQRATRTRMAPTRPRPTRQVALTHAPDLSATLRRLVTGVLGEVTDAVVITDLHHHIHGWNQSAERLYGWSEHEVLGRHVLEVLQPRDDGDGDRDLDAIWDEDKSFESWKGEARHRTRDGAAIDVLSSITLVRDHSGVPTLIVAVNRPTTAASAQEAAAEYDEDQIRMGIANDAFVVHYQPIVDLTDDQVIGMEALVRWDHPVRGLLAPDAFIAAAERSGAIIELGDVVFGKACTQAAEWIRTGNDLVLSVNLSARQLADPALYDRIVTVLAFTGLDPIKLWLEVTETALIDDVDRASAVLRRLAGLGIGIAVDDFGTGWASLTYLRSFPITGLKIDRSFVAGVGANAKDTAICRSIVALGKELGLMVIAEGIETSSQKRALRELGCTIGQGFLYGQPGPDRHLKLSHQASKAVLAPRAALSSIASTTILPASRRP